jgi:hypothetical protein
MKKSKKLNKYELLLSTMKAADRFPTQATDDTKTFIKDKKSRIGLMLRSIE